MVDLITSEAPHANLTSGEIRAPFNSIASALDKGSDAFEAVSKHLADLAGRKAVTVDPDGTPHVDQPPLPIVGPAGDTYRHALTLGAVAEGTGAVRRAVLDLRSKFPDDPEGFIKAAAEFRDATVKKYQEVGGPELGEAIGSTIDGTTTQTYRTLLNTRQRANLSGAAVAVLKSADTMSDDIASLASHGMTGSPDFQSLMSDYTAMMRTAVRNPLIPLDRADVDDHVERTIGRAEAAAFIGGVRRAYADGGDAAATKYADDAPDRLGNGLRHRADAEIDSLRAADDQRDLDKARSVIVAQDTRYAAGIARLTAGTLDQNWLDRNGDDVGFRNADRLRTALLATGAPVSAPGVASRLIDHALDDPSGAPNRIIDALSAGLVSRDDAGPALRLASAVGNDAQTRPWANEIRRDVQARHAPALGDVNLMLGTQNITSTQAWAAADEIVDRYVATDRKRLMATLPMPDFVPATRGELVNSNVGGQGRRLEMLQTARVSMLSAAQQGQLSLADFAAQHRLLNRWQDAIGKA